MKLDPMLMLLVLLNLDSGTTLQCKIRQRRTTTHRLCVQLDKNGMLKGRVVSCDKNEECNNPEYYPCGQKQITSSTNDPYSDDVITTEQKNVTNTPMIVPLKAPGIFRFNTSIVNASRTTYSNEPRNLTTTQLVINGTNIRTEEVTTQETVKINSTTEVNQVFSTVWTITSTSEVPQNNSWTPQATAVITKPPNLLNHIINGANIIISAITAVLIIIGFILIDFIL